MKHMFYLQFPVWVLASLLLSCSKQSPPPGTAALSIINGVTGSDPYLVPNFSGTEPLTWYNNGPQLRYGLANSNQIQLGSYQGEQKLGIYLYPDTTTHSTPLYNLTLPMPVGSIHTLFLTGTVTAPDYLFTTDTLPYHPPSDSSMGLRFINLSAGSSPVSVNMTGHDPGSEVSSLPYKGLSPFINYPATSEISDYTFEFRDGATGNLIGSYTIPGINNSTGTTSPNVRRYRNFTMALIGDPNDPSTLAIILIDGYSPY